MILANTDLLELGLALDTLADVNMTSPTLAFRVAKARRAVRPYREQFRIRELKLALEHAARKSDGTIDSDAPATFRLQNPDAFRENLADLLSEEVDVDVEPDLTLELLAQAGIMVSPNLVDGLSPLLTP